MFVVASLNLSCLMPIKQVGFDKSYNPRPCCADYVPMSERIRSYTDEAQVLETSSDTSYDDASVDITDVSIDFHFGVMDIAERRLAKLRADSKPKDEPTPKDEPIPKPADPAGNPE